MPKLHTELLTPDLYRRLNGAETKARAHEVIVVCTTDAAGWPHPAMISYFELVAVNTKSGTEVTGGITCSPRTGADLARAQAVLAELLEQ